MKIARVLHHGQPRTATVIAATPSRCWRPDVDVLDLLGSGSAESAEGLAARVEAEHCH